MDLSKRIEDQFKKHPQLRVLFLFDEGKELEKDIDSLQLNDIRVAKYSNEPFNLKVKLKTEWVAEKVLLYVPFAAPSTHDAYKKFPLLDVLVANKELRLGDVGDFMEQYQLPVNMQSLIAEYMRELKTNQVQEVLKPILATRNFTQETLQRGLVSAILKFNEPQPWDVLLTRLFILSKPANGSEFNRVIRKLKENKLDAILQHRLSDLFDESVTDISPELLSRLLKKLKYNIIVQNLPLAKHDPYGGLKIKHNTSLNKLGVFFEQARIHTKLGDDFIDTVIHQGQDIKEDTILQFYGPDADYAWMPNSLKWLILAERMKEIRDEPAKGLKGLEKMSLHHEDNPEIRNLVNACLYAANCFKFIDAITTYRLNTPEEYVTRYKEEFYKIDTAYRKAITRIGYIDHTEIPASVSLDELRAELNNEYEEWLEKLNREWLSCLQTRQFDYSKLSMPKQYDFYKSEVASFPDQKCVVFISDALRYEVGIELLHEMHNDTKSEAEIKYMLASVPSKTSVGMSNLLPGKKREFNNDEIRIDSILAKASSNRQTILQSANKNAVVVSYDEVQQNNQEQNRELFKAPVVYIYHNHIDATGDSPKSEYRTFKDVEAAINDIKKLVKRIHSNYNVARVLITADHGFIYNDRAISEADKEDAPGGDPVIQHNRFAIYDKPVKPALGYCIPLKSTTKFDDDKWVVFPASTNRYKRQGSGKQYVHGGASLQELIVPVIESARRREDITRKVGIKLLTSEPKIVSNILKVEILQENNVNRYEKARTVKLGIYKSYDLVSTLYEVVMDSASEMASERLFVCTVTLTKPDLAQSNLTLKIFDVEDSLNALIEKPVVNNTLIQTDF